MAPAPAKVSLYAREAYLASQHWPFAWGMALPEGSGWLQLYSVTLLCGIGFTMSLFIGALAFSGAPDLIDEVKMGVLLGSIFPPF